MTAFRQAKTLGFLAIDIRSRIVSQVARNLLAVAQPDSRRVRFGSIEAVKRCVAAGLGWTVLPTVTADTELRAGTLVAPAAPLPPAPTVHLATHPDRRRPCRAEPDPRALEPRPIADRLSRALSGLQRGDRLGNAR